jgi:predicted transcriptional regulator
MGALEDAIMEILWRAGAWLTPSEVHAELSLTRAIAYTTVTTVLTRLYEKDRLERRKDGRAFAYHATSTRSEWAADQMDRVLAAASDHKSTLNHFHNRLDEADRTQLRRMLLNKERT